MSDIKTKVSENIMLAGLKKLGWKHIGGTSLVKSDKRVDLDNGHFKLFNSKDQFLGCYEFNTDNRLVYHFLEIEFQVVISE